MLLEVRRDVNAQQPQRPPEIPKDPSFNTALLRLPAESRFPIPGTGVVQRIAVDLLNRLLAMGARDPHDARLRANARTGIPVIKYLPAYGDRLFVRGDGGPCKPASSPWCPARTVPTEIKSATMVTMAREPEPPTLEGSRPVSCGSTCSGSGRCTKGQTRTVTLVPLFT